MKTLRLVTTFVVLSAAGCTQNRPQPQGVQQFANLGDFKLENGEIIRDCRIGYRTFGHINADRSNVLLFTTWADGQTSQLGDSIGPGKLADTTQYFVVAVDALGNGISSSPSNSRTQPHMRFPEFSVRDMVESQHRLLTDVLHINHLRAVIGYSMGGMQAFQWAVAYPDFMDKVVPIVGSPRLAAYDLLLWQTRIDAMERDPSWHNGDYRDEPIAREVDEIGQLMLTTPEHYNRENSLEKFFADLKKPAVSWFDTNDRIRQEQAMMRLDISAPFGGLMQRAAAAVKASMLIIVDSHDHMVTPGPALEFAKLIKAPTLILDNDCGHLGPGCDMPKVVAAVAAFLEK